MKGIIALDIDGTLTYGAQMIPQEILDYITSLSHEGWQLIFLTGRSYQRALQVLEKFHMHYFLAAYNGAVIVEMPEKRIIDKTYLYKDVIPIMEQICETEMTDFVLYAGLEFDDRCFFRPQQFSAELKSYLSARFQSNGEKWIGVSSFDQLETDHFASLKCFGEEEMIMRIAKKIVDRIGLHVPVIQDPFRKGYFVAQATHATVNKGKALKDCLTLLRHCPIIIAAGDDENDISMFDQSNIAIAMASAPSNIRALADIIAPSAMQNGIIAGLKDAIRLSQGFMEKSRL